MRQFGQPSGCFFSILDGMTEHKSSSLFEALRQEVLEGTRPQWYTGQRAQYQREEAQRGAEQARREAQERADLERAVNEQIDRLKREGKWL